MFLEPIDFAQMYVNHKKSTIFKGKDHNEWDKKSKELAPSMQKSAYVDEFISKMEIDPNDVILDIGCGPGTLAIPLAKKAKHVIAIDFSKSMLEELEKYAKKEGIENISTYHIGWDDDWSFLPDIDIAVASRSMEVSDMQSALFKMSYIAKKACYLTYKVGGSYVDMDIVNYIQKPIVQKPDYWYIPLILYTKQYLAKIDYIATKGSIKSYTKESFVESLRWSFGSLTEAEEEKAKEYYEHFIAKEQKHPKPFSWAFISWKTTPLEL
ncbi:class I SAM-dependent methyltransferase [Sulfurimonas marina]|uniref:Methyltransferase domain-containing protein n=1 Tax=Sulfurimonas marina TaxID=2590551 RepID=A0A7M1AWD1_9BACT|nr:methyltransferase domain-containing protein [Sulfurimonas marina]QOP41767.1 methyltransferase domain-containing protein [Sulfurimonas marina]